ncbi:phage prohead protease, HK97 family [Gottschalkia purinilytica]|uniref:Phage prohead protease, HK97 family n=2 Tax=Gottschalkia purinilytica TaxID=1503 RepID=A0A0L0W661_GOTPU|nr:phage prohead protease, HK97 family [Gottschalkia purinilytica]
MEQRTFQIRNLQVRDNSSGKGATIGGYAAVFNQYTTIRDRWGDEFQEQIVPGAFEEALENNSILALYNHDWSNVLARKDVNMTLQEDDVGLKFEINLPDTQLSRDLSQLMAEGIVNQCSFGAYVKKNEWKFTEDGDFRILQELDLREITITPIPAYPQTNAEVRSVKGDQPVDKNWEKRKQEIINKYSKYTNKGDM